jgi:hypothetical protein
MGSTTGRPDLLSRPAAEHLPVVRCGERAA